MRRRIAIVTLTIVAMTAGPGAISAASAATPSGAPRLCVAQGTLGTGVCLPPLF